MKIGYLFSLKKVNQPNGSILIETLISIVLLGLIVVGSIYSYSLVHQRILSQRQQRVALGVLQGWMEQTSSHLFSYPDPNALMKQPVLDGIKNHFILDVFNDDIANMFVPGTNIVPGIEIHPNGKNIIDIRIWVTINGLPVTLYTQLYTKKS